MVVKLNICITGRVFGKICAEKLSEIPFFQICGPDQEKNGVRNEGNS